MSVHQISEVQACENPPHLRNLGLKAEQLFLQVSSSHTGPCVRSTQRACENMDCGAQPHSLGSGSPGVQLQNLFFHKSLGATDPTGPGTTFQEPQLQVFIEHPPDYKNGPIHGQETCTQSGDSECMHYLCKKNYFLKSLQRIH